jgi:hypothetical protein
MSDMLMEITKHMELPDLELVAEKVHEAWLENKRNQGVLSRNSESRHSSRGICSD